MEVLELAKQKNTLGLISFILVVVGALNWGLVGLFRFDLVAALFATMPGLQKVVYILIGLAAVFMIMDMLKK